MKTTFADFNHPSTFIPEIEKQNLIEEYLEAFVPKICCLEGYWSQDMTDTFSLNPCLKAIGWMLEKKVRGAHRHISSVQELDYYVKFPDGLVHKDPYLAGIDCFYLAAHGKPGGLKTYTSDIESEELISAFSWLHQGFNIVFFGACEIFAGEEGKRFAMEFLRKTGTVAVLGYSEETTFVDGLVIETLFLTRFFETEGNKFEQLQEIFNGVVRDYPRAMDCGFEMYLNENNS